MNVAAFNVFWFGTGETERIARTPDDEAFLARVFDRLDADAVLLSEIVSLERLEAVFARTRRRWCLRDPEGRWVTSADPRAKDFDRDLKVVLAWDPATVALEEFGALRNRNQPQGTRRPLVARVRHVASDWSLTLVGVHLKSGPLDAAPGDSEAEKRRAECAHLAAWLSGGGDTPPPPTPDVLVGGDFNAPRDHFSLAPLTSGPLAPWTWQPVVFPDAPGESWTSWMQRQTIDHLLTSPTLSARAAGPAAAYAFDLDPALDRPPPEGPGWLRRVTGFEAVPLPGADRQPVENLYRVSDHRPVRVALVPP